MLLRACIGLCSVAPLDPTPLDELAGRHVPAAVGPAALLALGATAVATPSAARCPRFTATILSDSGRTATLRGRIKFCGADRYNFCIGRFRCRGDACQTRRGRLHIGEPFFDAETAPLGRRRGRGTPLGCSFSAFDALDATNNEFTTHYSCFVNGRSLNPLSDEGTITIEFDRDIRAAFYLQDERCRVRLLPPAR